LNRRLLALNHFDLVARQKSIPRHARLDGLVTRREPGGRKRNRDEVVAGRTLNLFARMTFVALDVPVAVRAGEFEFAHRFLVLILDRGERIPIRTNNHDNRRVTNQCEMPDQNGSKIFGKVF